MSGRRLPSLDQISLDLMIEATDRLRIRRTRANCQKLAGLQIAIREAMRAVLPGGDPRRDPAYPFASSLSPAASPGNHEQER